MSPHQERQNGYFARRYTGERFDWQTKDPFVMAHEHATLATFVDALRRLLAERGRLRILESGCGEGVNFAHLRQMGLSPDRVHIEGVDPTAEAVAVARRNGLEAQVGDGLALPYADGSFDVVFCRDVLHHPEGDEERRRFLSEMTRVAKPATAGRVGGLVAAIEPNPWNPMIFLLSIGDWAERGLRSITASRILRIKPGATVTPAAPSALWRATWRLRGWLRRHPSVDAFVLRLLGRYEIVSKHGPKALWSYRIYLWNT